MKQSYLLTAFLLITVSINAQQVTEEQALQKAQEFLNKKAMSANGSRHNGPRKLLQMTKAVQNDAYYIFNAEQNGGFVIVSGDERTEEILGYSTDGNINPLKMPENMSALLNCYERQIKAIPINAKAAPVKIPTHSAVEPLITAEWNQATPYNLQCPKLTSESGLIPQNSLTGCVATAMAQIMYYYKWPQEYTTSIPAYDYGWDNQGVYKYHAEELSPAKFDWANMKDKYNGSETDASANAVAQLMHYCGQSLFMEYGLDQSRSMTTSIMYALYHYFNYSKTIRQINQFDYTPEEWDATIYDEIVNNRPVVLSGHSYTGGHAFVCDGYDGQGMYHINWGWGGFCNGFFKLSVLNPYDNSYNTGYDTFSLYWGSAIVGIQKPYNGETISANMVISSKLSFDCENGRIWFNYDNKSNETFFIDEAIGITSLDNSYTSIHIINENISIDPFELQGTQSYWCSSVGYLLADDFFKMDGSYRLIPLYKEHGSHQWISGPDNGIDNICYQIQYSNGIMELLNEPVKQAYLEVTNVTYAGSIGNRMFYDVTFKNNGESLWCHLRYNFLDVSESLQPFKDEPHWLLLTELNIESGCMETVRLFFDYDGSNSGDYKLAIVLNDTYNQSNQSWGYGFPIIYQGVIHVTNPQTEIEVTDISQLSDAIYVTPLTGTKGSPLAMEINLKNSQEATAYVFDLVLPEGITVAKNANGKYIDVLSDRHDDHTRTFNYKGDNIYSLSTLSGNSELLTGNDGPIRILTLDVSDSMAEGTYSIKVKNASYSLADGSLKTLPNTTSAIIIEDYILGDVNGNGGVDIGDAVSIVNYLVGKTSSNFVEKAADTNKNGQVDIGDAVTIVNYLVGKTTSLVRSVKIWDEKEPQ